jgi:hypothetical protein
MHLEYFLDVRICFCTAQISSLVDVLFSLNSTASRVGAALDFGAYPSREAFAASEARGAIGPRRMATTANTAAKPAANQRLPRPIHS